MFFLQSILTKRAHSLDDASMPQMHVFLLGCASMQPRPTMQPRPLAFTKKSSHLCIMLILLIFLCLFILCEDTF
jgi:hypothetical protein